jgi:hypothetical protein
MTLQETAQILGGVGVIASIIYVGIQIRNNARAVRAATYQQLTASITNSLDTLFQNDEACNLVLRAGDDFNSLDRLEKARYRFFFMAMLRRYGNAWFQYRIGTLRTDDWQQISSNLEALFSVPGNAVVWQLLKTRFPADFCKFIDEMIERLTPIAAAYVPPAPIPVVAKIKLPKTKPTKA